MFFFKKRQTVWNRFTQKRFGRAVHAGTARRRVGCLVVPDPQGTGGAEELFQVFFSAEKLPYLALPMGAQWRPIGRVRVVHW